jgi:quercetin dioxygenase-like cupin family protein
LSRAARTGSAPPNTKAPIAQGPGEGEALWFVGGLTIIKASGETTGGRVAATENHAPRGAGSPLQVHRREDQWFYVIEGELTLWVGGLGDEQEARWPSPRPRNAGKRLVIGAA